MESESTAVESIRELHRAQLLAHTRYPRPGVWYPPIVGAFAAYWVAMWSLDGVARVAAALVFAVAVGLATGAYARRRGARPKMRTAPPELKREMKRFFVGAAVIAAVVAGAYLAGSWWLAAAITFVLVTAGIARYEQRYARAAAMAEANSGLISDQS